MKQIIAILLITILAACHSKQDKPAASSESSVKRTITFPKPKVPIKTVGILLYDGYTALDAMGPYQVLRSLQDAKVFFVGRHKGYITDENALEVKVDSSIDEVKHLDILIVPGGLRETYLATKDAPLLRWIKSIDSGSTYTASVCMGSWILAAAGLLKDHPATSHWYGKTLLANEFGVKVQNERYVQSGKYWTSAGITAGMDMSLAMVNAIQGEDFTKLVMLNMEYDPKPPFNAGSEEKTDKDLVAQTRAQYDGAMETVLHPEKALKNLTYAISKDPSCGMPLRAGVSDTAHYKGKLYGFCSPECKSDFLSNPSAHL